MLAGVLSGKRAAKLESHLRGCPSCRAFEREARLIQEKAPALIPRETPPGDWQGSMDRLRARLAGEARKEGREIVRRPAWGLKWAAVAAPLLLAAAVGLYVLLPGGAATGRLYVSAEEQQASMAFELEDNPELLSAFNQVLESSLVEEMGAAGPGSHGLDNPLLFQEVTDEELAFVLEELKKETTS
jgi:hypothetical protein